MTIIDNHISIAQLRGHAAWAEAIFKNDRVRSADVWRICSDVFPFGLMSLADADALFAIETHVSHKCPEWSALFCELITDYVVWGQRPTGIVDPAQADWLLAHVERAGSNAANATLLNIVSEASQSPDRLRDVAQTSMQDQRTMSAEAA